LRELREHRVTPDTADQIEAAFIHLVGLPGVRGDCIGLFGISISGGLALTAAARPSMNEELCYTITFGAFHDIEQLMLFAATSCRGSGDAACDSSVSEYTRSMFLFNSVGGAAHESDPDYGSLSEVLSLRLHQQTQPLPMATARMAAAMARLSPAARTMLDKANRGDRQTLENLLQRAQTRYGAFGHQLSPSANLCNLKGSLHIMHGLSDNTIPAGESERMFEQCNRCGNLTCDLLVTDLYGHVNSTGSKWRKLDEVSRLLVFLHRVAGDMVGGRRHQHQRETLAAGRERLPLR
jgi:pimeloyl-ACP methyl ester carboxylesterase